MKKLPFKVIFCAFFDKIQPNLLQKIAFAINVYKTKQQKKGLRSSPENFYFTSQSD